MPMGMFGCLSWPLTSGSWRNCTDLLKQNSSAAKEDMMYRGCKGYCIVEAMLIISHIEPVYAAYDSVCDGS